MDEHRRTYERIGFEWMDKGQEQGFIIEYPSHVYRTELDAYEHEDVIEAYAVEDSEEHKLWLELVSQKFHRRRHIELLEQDRESPQYGAELLDTDFLFKKMRVFDAEIHHSLNEKK